MDDRLVQTEAQAVEARACFRRNAMARTSAAEQYLQRAQKWSCLSTTSVDSSATKRSPQRILEDLRQAATLSMVAPPVPEVEVVPAAREALPEPLPEHPLPEQPLPAQPEPSLVPLQEPVEQPTLEPPQVQAAEPQASEPAAEPQVQAAEPQPSESTFEPKGVPAVPAAPAKAVHWTKSALTSWRELQAGRVLMSTVLLIGIASFFVGLFMGVMISK